MKKQDFYYIMAFDTTTGGDHPSINFFSSLFTLRSNFFRSSAGGKSSGFIPLCPNISLTLEFF